MARAKPLVIVVEDDELQREVASIVLEECEVDVDPVRNRRGRNRDSGKSVAQAGNDLHRCAFARCAVGRRSRISRSGKIPRSPAVGNIGRRVSAGASGRRAVHAEAMDNEGVSQGSVSARLGAHPGQSSAPLVRRGARDVRCTTRSGGRADIIGRVEALPAPLMSLHRQQRSFCYRLCRRASPTFENSVPPHVRN